MATDDTAQVEDWESLKTKVYIEYQIIWGSIDNAMQYRQRDEEL